MLEIIGTHNTAVCYTGELESAAEAQIKTVSDRTEVADCKIRITCMFFIRMVREVRADPGVVFTHHICVW